MEIQEIVTDFQLDIVFEGLNTSIELRRPFIKNWLLRIACNIPLENDGLSILIELGLISIDHELTRIGKKYLWHSSNL